MLQDLSKGAAANPGLNGYRLTLSTGTPVPSADVTAAGTLYLTPYKHSEIALYTGSVWKVHKPGEISISLTGISTTAPTDVFVYDNSGTVTLELLAWTNDTTRATNLVRQDGVWCKTGALTRRYVGTIYGSAANVCEDSNAKRYVWNADNRVVRGSRQKDSTSSWTYASTTRRQANNGDADWRHDFVVGLDEDHMRVVAAVLQEATVAVPFFSIGIDSTTSEDTGAGGGTFTEQIGGGQVNATPQWIGRPGVGKHFVCAIEWNGANSTTTRYAGVYANFQTELMR